jgi:hypothetical protein
VRFLVCNLCFSQATPLPKKTIQDPHPPAPCPIIDFVFYALSLTRRLDSTFHNATTFFAVVRLPLASSRPPVLVVGRFHPAVSISSPPQLYATSSSSCSCLISDASSSSCASPMPTPSFLSLHNVVPSSNWQ